MTRSSLRIGLGSAAALVLAAQGGALSAQADEATPHGPGQMMSASAPMTDAPPPAGLFGAAMAPEGRIMFGYTPMFMHMSGNYMGSGTVSSQTIATTVPSNTVMGNGSNEMYRIVPTSMDVESHMFHLMYGVTDWLNAAVMVTYLNKSMTMTTFQGSSGTTVAGQSTSTTHGFGDTSVAGTIRLYQDDIHHLHLNAGLSLPSGSITETATMLSPKKSFMTMRATYGMQLGTGTVDLMPGITYTGHLHHWNWGLAYRGRVALDDNSQGYDWGPQHSLDGWGGYAVIPGITLTARTEWSSQGRIHGYDSNISGLMQGANPAFYGGTRLDMMGGVVLSGALIGQEGVKLGLEGGAPVYQDLNGPQLGRNWQINLALSAGF